jgi:hypothetical protein
MGLLSGSHSNGQIPYYTGLQIQTSSRKLPIAIVWGSNKVAPNCIWTGRFYGYYGYPEGSHGGSSGKGGGHGSSGQSASQSWQYYTSWEMALCEGPIDGIGTIWLGQNATNFYGPGPSSLETNYKIRGGFSPSRGGQDRLSLIAALPM